jgi:hypothetical protein
VGKSVVLVREVFWWGKVMASDSVQMAVVREVASGVAISQVAESHGYTVAGLRNLLKQPHMQEKLNQAKEVLDLKATHLYAKTWLAADAALDGIIKVSETEDHKKSYDAKVYLLEKVWPTKHVVEEHRTVNIDADMTVRLLDAIEDMKKVRGKRLVKDDIRSDPHLKSGKDVIYEQENVAARKPSESN